MAKQGEYTILVNGQWVAQLQGNKHDLNRAIKRVKEQNPNTAITYKKSYV